MKILLCSVPFRPSVGGIETVSAILAEQFHRAGHTVTLLTQTPDDNPQVEAFNVLRRPPPAALWRAVLDADVVLHNNISLRLGWPLALAGRPWVVAHHTWTPNGTDIAGQLKRVALRRAHNIAASSALAAALPVACSVVPNPYDSALFRCIEGVPRSRDIVFVGRLVSDKGVDLLLRALALLRAGGRTPTLSIIGSGPEEAALRRQVQTLGLQRQVGFAGRLVGQPLVRALNAHRVVAVPSLWEEPFGLVALEALACGCLPVVAASGGLAEAAGPGALVFAKGDAAELARQLAVALQRWQPADEVAVQQHLRRHQPARVAQAYLEVLEHAGSRRGTLAGAA